MCFHFQNRGVKMDTFFFISKLTIKIILPWCLALFGIHQFLYSKYPKYYFFVAKRFSKWRDTTWKLNVSYDINKSEDFFSEFEKIVKEIYDSKPRKKFNLKNKKQYEFDDFTLTIQYDLNMSQTEKVTVELDFNTMNITLVNAKNKLKKLRVFFNELEKELPLMNPSYNIDIFFKTVKNPFYGLMIQRLGDEHIEFFQCDFPISTLLKKEKLKDSFDLKDFKLTVFKDKITINESNFHSLEEVATISLLLG